MGYGHYGERCGTMQKQLNMLTKALLYRWANPARIHSYQPRPPATRRGYQGWVARPLAKKAPHRERVPRWMGAASSGCRTSRWRWG